MAKRKFAIYIECPAYGFSEEDLWVDPEERPEEPTAADVVSMLKDDYESPTQAALYLNINQPTKIHVDGPRDTATWDEEKDS